MSKILDKVSTVQELNSIMDLVVSDDDANVQIGMSQLMIFGKNFVSQFTDLCKSYLETIAEIEQKKYNVEIIKNFYCGNYQSPKKYDNVVKSKKIVFFIKVLDYLGIIRPHKIYPKFENNKIVGVEFSLTNNVMISLDYYEDIYIIEFPRSNNHISREFKDAFTEFFELYEEIENPLFTKANYYKCLGMYISSKLEIDVNNINSTEELRKEFLDKFSALKNKTNEKL